MFAKTQQNHAMKVVTDVLDQIKINVFRVNRISHFISNLEIANVYNNAQMHIMYFFNFLSWLC